MNMPPQTHPAAAPGYEQHVEQHVSYSPPAKKFRSDPSMTFRSDANGSDANVVPEDEGVVRVLQMDAVTLPMLATALEEYLPSRICMEGGGRNAALVIFRSASAARNMLTLTKYGNTNNPSFVRIQKGSVDRDLILEMAE
jgi:hypothetical protein